MAKKNNTDDNLEAAKVEALEALAKQQQEELDTLKAAPPAQELKFDTPFEVAGVRYAFKNGGSISFFDRELGKRRALKVLEVLQDTPTLEKLLDAHPQLFNRLDA